MDTTEMKEFVQGIALLWEENKRRELLYIRLMKSDQLGSFRRLCNQGHITALLFQKEIQWIYDYFKCNLNDSDLQTAFESATSIQETGLDGMEDNGTLVRLAKEVELTTIRGYQSVIRFIDQEGEVYDILRDHLDRITHLCGEFGRETSHFKRSLSPLYS
jgi:hypothetical protein